MSEGIEIDYGPCMKNPCWGQVVYRAFAADGELLYIGVTNNPPHRFYHHECRSPWWHEVAKVELSTFETRTLAESAEADAIRDEAPRYNIEHNVNRPPPRPEQLQKMREAMAKLSELLMPEYYKGTEAQSPTMAPESAS